MTSILTNNGAMVALQTLKTVNNGLEETQNQISTGKEVGMAKDTPRSGPSPSRWNRTSRHMSP